MCAPPPRLRLRAIGSDSLDCLVLAGASPTTPSDNFSAAGCGLDAQWAAGAEVHSGGEGRRLHAVRQSMGCAVPAGPFRRVGRRCSDPSRHHRRLLGSHRIARATQADDACPLCAGTCSHPPASVVRPVLRPPEGRYPSGTFVQSPCQPASCLPICELDHPHFGRNWGSRICPDKFVCTLYFVTVTFSLICSIPMKRTICPDKITMKRNNSAGVSKCRSVEVKLHR